MEEETKINKVEHSTSSHLTSESHGQGLARTDRLGLSVDRSEVVHQKVKKRRQVRR